MEHPELVKTLTLGEAPVMPLLQNVAGGDSMINNFITKVFIPAGEAFKNNDSVSAVKIFIAGVMDDSLYYSKLPEMARSIMNDNILETRGTAFTKNPFPLVTCEDLRKVRTPVLLVKGSKSPQFLISITNELQRCLMNSETATLENTSHGLQFENPSAFNEAVLRFLDKH